MIHPKYLFFASGILLVSAFIVPPYFNSKTFFLFDQSLSMGEARDMSYWSEQPGFPLKEWAEILEENDINGNGDIYSFPSEKTYGSHNLNTSDLSKALYALHLFPDDFGRSKIRDGDKLYVISDGRSLSPFSDGQDWKNINVVWVKPTFESDKIELFLPRVAFPDSFVAVDIFGSGVAEIDFELQAATNNLESLESFSFGLDHKRIRFLVSQNLFSQDASGLDRRLGFQLKKEKEAIADWDMEILLNPSIRPFSEPFDWKAIREYLNGGESVLLQYSDIESLLQTPLDLKLFSFSHNPEHYFDYLFLLDVSGSMEDDGAFLEAISALQELRDSLSVNFQINTFSNRVNSGFSLSSISELSNIRPYGPTDIIKVIQELGMEDDEYKRIKRIFLLSDGKYSIKGVDLATELEKYLPNIDLLVLPCGKSANLSALESWGPVVSSSTSLSESLKEVVGEIISPDNSGPVYRVDNVGWNLPEKLSFSSNRLSSLDVVKSGTALMQEVNGDASLAVKVFPYAQLYASNSVLPEGITSKVAEIDAAFRARDFGVWFGEYYYVHSDSIPILVQFGEEVRPQLVSATSNEALWRFPAKAYAEFDLTLDGIEQKVFPVVQSEYLASTQYFSDWLAAREKEEPFLNFFLFRLSWLIFIVAFCLYYR